MPFKWREDREDKIFEAVKKSLDGHHPFELALHGFGAFKPRVIFIHIEENQALKGVHDSLKRNMKSELNIFNAEYKGRGFNPHLTLAFRDLKKSMFLQAWKEFENKSYQALFPVDSIVLLKHNGKSWDIYKTFDLRK
ncbi:2'-5' RNA ligase [Fulvivirga imtechensis AK7]|uniref:2'-5' RNA ligase n=2 Tax=Fulvivirga TaxID=396811 RepID=L8JL32_9BACT|nr:2'-5' RNA ligase [Fulvivirga imtechensis AK7]